MLRTDAEAATVYLHLSLTNSETMFNFVLIEGASR